MVPGRRHQRETTAPCLGGVFLLRQTCRHQILEHFSQTAVRTVKSAQIGPGIRAWKVAPASFTEHRPHHSAWTKSA
jgi:hypothetical protein